MVLLEPGSDYRENRFCAGRCLSESNDQR
jgi:hypothetical protein